MVSSSFWALVPSGKPSSCPLEAVPYLGSDKSIWTHGSFEPMELRAGVQEQITLPQCVHTERQWAHPGPPNLPGLTVKVPDPPLSPNGPASPRDFKFVNKNHCCGYLVLSALSPVCRLGRSGFQLEVWGLGVGEMGKKKWKTARGSFSLGKACLPPAGLRSTQLSSGLLLPWGLLDVSQVLSDPVPRDPHQCQLRKSLLEVPCAG